MIGMEKPIIKVRRVRIHKDQVRQMIECCGAARGAATIKARALPTATGLTPRMRATLAVFVAPARNKSRDEG